ncbi:hypothetical protein DFQ27_000611 [Actinomortierella ambigua]|uniref:Peptidase M20 domain-containing protein 2 n=1 Tax=Actinomortierella ambigua TaxID=1343610 RepID=A0A9P6U9N2_9FUNG|nr:hypothetical protein DFQ27_000611 [Actinomortierella ambigua]
MTHKSLSKEVIAETIDRASPLLRDLSWKIHDHPELGYKEVYAHKTLTDFLESQGFQVTRHACGIETAFVADFEYLGEGDHMTDRVRSIGFCSEFDALPSVGHGCGHNLIAITGVAAALAIRQALIQHKIPGKVRLLGTPAEETLGGKIPMLAQEAFSGLDACLMVHPGPADVLYRQPLGVGRLEVEFFGHAAHASASPSEGVNALDAFAIAYNAVAMLRQQSLPTNRIHSILTHGGEADNIIPDYVTGVFMYRAVQNQDFVKLHDRLVEILEAAAKATGCRVKINKVMEYLPLNNNSILTERFGEYMRSMGASYATRTIEETMPTGSTDMGNVTRALPGFHPVFTIANLDSRREDGLSTHSLRFAELSRTETAHLTALRSAKAMAMTGLDVLVDPDFTRLAREEYDHSMGH